MDRWIDGCTDIKRFNDVLVYILGSALGKTKNKRAIFVI